MKINCLIVEDEKPAAELLSYYIEQQKKMNLIDVITNYDSFLNYSLEKIDVLFLDIRLHSNNSLVYFSDLHFKPITIITSAYPDYAVEGFELEVCDYLLKPYSYQRFEKAILKAEQKLITRNKLMVENLGKSVLIDVQTIIYINAYGEYVKIKTTLNPQSILTKGKMNYFEELLAQSGIIRAHRSFLVNSNYIASIKPNQIILNDGTIIPIGRLYKNQLFYLLTKKNI